MQKGASTGFSCTIYNTNSDHRAIVYNVNYIYLAMRRHNINAPMKAMEFAASYLPVFLDNIYTNKYIIGNIALFQQQQQPLCRGKEM